MRNYLIHSRNGTLYEGSAVNTITGVIGHISENSSNIDERRKNISRTTQKHPQFAPTQPESEGVTWYPTSTLRVVAVLVIDYSTGQPTVTNIERYYR